MKRFLSIIFALLAVLIIVSCNQDPKASDDPAPAPAPAPSATDEDVLAGNAYYRLTATREAKRFALQYLDEEDSTYDPDEGDVLTLKYRTNHSVDRIYLRDSSQNTVFSDGSYHTIAEADDEYVTGPDEDGWYTFTFTFPEMLDTKFGFRLELCNYGVGKFQPGDYLDIKDLEFKGQKLTIEAADEDNEYQSNQGVYNAGYTETGNKDHTLPTLSIIKL